MISSDKGTLESGHDSFHRRSGKSEKIVNNGNELGYSKKRDKKRKFGHEKRCDSTALRKKKKKKERERNN